MNPPGINFSRRDTLKLIAAAGGAAAATFAMPSLVHALAAAQFPEPDLMRPVNSTALYQGYLLNLQKNGFAPTPVDTLYALTCTTRSGIPLNTGSATLSYEANSLVDQSVAAPVNTGPVAPTMVFTRGKSNGVFFQNVMTGCGQDFFIPDTDPASHYTPHAFTVANLHTHGLHVSPNAPEDDVLILVSSSNVADPDDGSTYDGVFSYRYQVPDTHPVGTFWYHPHKHGSVSTQLATGMAGALIVRSGKDDDDFDQLLAERCNVTETDERIMVFSTINYTAEQNRPGSAVFDPQLYAFNTPSPGCPVGTGAQDLSVMLVNGQTYPTLTMKKGEIQRWRIVNATVGQVIIPKLKNDQLGISPSGIEAVPAVPDVYAVAVDGIALPAFYPSGSTPPADNAPYYPIDYSLTDTTTPKYLTTGELITVAAGQRLDLIVQAKDSGYFVLWGADLDEAPNVVEANGDGSTPGNVYTRPLLRVQVTSEARADQSLPTYALFKEPTIQRPPSGLTLSQGRPPLQGGDTIAYRSMAFSDPISGPAFTINGQYFEQGNPPTAQVRLQLNATDWWYNYSQAGSHIFHIHINSFQLVARCGTVAGLPDPASAVTYELPIWRDTLYFDSRAPKGQTKDGRGVISVSKQVDYTGEFVMHCHNVFHEDSGMMLTVSIEDPAAPPAAGGRTRARHKH